MTRLVFGLSLLCFSSGEFVQTLVGEKLTLVSAERCLDAGKGSLVHLSPHGALQDVAQLLKGRWSPKAAYRDRLSPGGAVEFKEAAFNDNGVYELTCSTIPKTVIIEVEVLVPYEVWTSVGQSQRLQCYFRTRGEAVDSVRWDRGTELVIQQQLGSGKTLYGDRFKDRVVLSQDVQRKGDLSLSLQSIQPQDQGNFFCKIQVSGRDWANGKPAVVRLWVTEKNNSLSLDNINNMPFRIWIWLLATIGLLILLLCISFYFLLTKTKSAFCSKKNSTKLLSQCEGKGSTDNRDGNGESEVSSNPP